MRLCIFSGRQFEETVEKSIQMQPMRLCIFLGRQFEETVGKKRTSATICDFPSIQAGDFRKHLKTPLVKKRTNATNATLHLFGQTS